jgi:Sec-independent protein translocase protein TatA
MSAKTKLRSALRSIDDAMSALRRASGNADPDSQHQIRRAMSELDDAERDIKRAIREIPDA